jgi:hypothetical protein
LRALFKRCWGNRRAIIPSLRSIEAIGLNEQFSGVNEQVRGRLLIFAKGRPMIAPERAKEARALAEQIDDPEAKRTMLATADDYERLAKRAEERAAGRLPQNHDGR